MRLFRIQDSDRPMYVVAIDWQDALKKWKRVISTENDIPNIDDVEEPQGITMICEEDELILIDL